MTPKAGRELDALIGEHVMEWYVYRTATDMRDGWKLGDGQDFPAYASGTYAFTVPYFSTDLHAAWSILDQKLTWPRFWTTLLQTNSGKWRCDIDLHGGDGPVRSAAAETPELAICLAALRATGYGDT